MLLTAALAGLVIALAMTAALTTLLLALQRLMK